MDITNQRKADENQQEQPEKENRNKQEERGVKSSTDDLEMHAKESKARAEGRAEQNKKAKVSDDTEHDAIIEAIGAVGLNESGLKCNEAVEKFIKLLSQETFGEFYDAISREVLDSELIKKAKEAEMETFRKHEAYEKVPLEDCWKVTGRAPVGVK